MIWYLENPKDATRKLLELINEFCKVAGHRINTQKSIAFLYTNNERSEREIRETIPYTTASKRRKYLGINLKRQKTCTMKPVRCWSKKSKKTQRWNDTPWKSQYFQNYYNTQGNLLIQCNSYQITRDVFHRTRIKYFKVCLEA